LSEQVTDTRSPASGANAWSRSPGPPPSGGLSGALLLLVLLPIAGLLFTSSPGALLRGPGPTRWSRRPSA
jgi:hypothetical protein